MDTSLQHSSNNPPVNSLLNDIALKTPMLSREHSASVQDEWLLINGARCIPLLRLQVALIAAATLLEILDDDLKSLHARAKDYSDAHPECEIGQRLLQATAINCSSVFGNVMTLTARWQSSSDKALLDVICETAKAAHSLLALPSSIHEATSQLLALPQRGSAPASRIDVALLSQALEIPLAKSEWKELCEFVRVSLPYIELLSAHLGNDSQPIFLDTQLYLNRRQHNAAFQVGVSLRKEGIGPEWKTSETQTLHEACLSLDSFKDTLLLAQLCVELYNELAGPGKQGPQQRLRECLEILRDRHNMDVIPEPQRLFRILDAIPSHLEDIRKIETQEVPGKQFAGEDERLFASLATDITYLLRSSISFLLIVDERTSWRAVGAGIRSLGSRPLDSLTHFRDIMLNSSAIKKVTAKSGLVDTRQSKTKIIGELTEQIAFHGRSLESFCKRIGFLPETTNDHYIPSRPDSQGRKR